MAGGKARLKRPPAARRETQLLWVTLAGIPPSDALLADGRIKMVEAE